MTGHGEKLTRKQEAAIADLLGAPTVTAAAAQVGVGERTIRRWLREPSFAAAYRVARRQSVELALARLQQAAGEAVDTLRANLKAEKAADQNRAAVAILEHCLRYSEAADLAAEVEDLRRRIDGSGDDDAGGTAGAGEAGQGDTVGETACRN
jgi:hypothetical protein